MLARTSKVIFQVRTLVWIVCFAMALTSCSDSTVQVPIRYTLTYTALDAGTIEGDATQEVVRGEDGTPVTAVPAEGYQFDVWSDGVVTADRHDTDVKTELTVTARFVSESESGPYSIGGSLEGLVDGAVLVVSNNDENDFELISSMDGSRYALGVQLELGDPYDISIVSTPARHNCEIENASGVVEGDVTDVNIVCSAMPLIAAGNFHSMMIKTDGSLWAWGINSRGQLGVDIPDGAQAENVLTPTRVGEANDWNYVRAGNFHTTGIKSDGSLWAWGFNENGQLGLDDTEDRETPQQVGSDFEWASLATGNWRGSMALKSDGSLWAWGRNNFGQLGVGDEEDRHTPARVGEGEDWIRGELAQHALGIRADGTLWAWGSAGNGRLGLPDFENKLVPTQVGTREDWRNVSIGVFHSLAVREDGTLWAWGTNSNGQIGQADDESRREPTQIGTETDWRTVVAGDHYSFGIKEDGTLWAWGRNESGELGLGDEENRLEPTQVGVDANWHSVATGNQHTIALKTAGTVWAWGRNVFGQLGVGDTTWHSTPQLIVEMQ